MFVCNKLQNVFCLLSTNLDLIDQSMATDTFLHTNVKKKKQNNFEHFLILKPVLKHCL